MSPPILVAGLDSRSLLLEAPVLQRERQAVEERPGGRELIQSVAAPSDVRLVVLGSQLSDLSLPEAIRRLRSSQLTRHVSILALIPAFEPEELDRQALAAGANAVLRRPLDTARLESWIAKLLTVPRRVEARVMVQGQVVGTPRAQGAGHFYGLTRNLSIHGMLLASPVRLPAGPDVELELSLPDLRSRMKALGRVVREAAEVRWPYLGYGIEFLFVPAESHDTITRLVASGLEPKPGGGAPGSHGIYSTFRRDAWVYEILEPVPYGAGWEAEIRRAPRDHWRPGVAGPFYVVVGATREEALLEARRFLGRMG
jgi:CheY-like chemotaxis protein